MIDQSFLLQVNFAEVAGARGMILFSDPADFSSTVNYPNSWFLPDTAIQRGNILRQKGDPLSPGYPSLGNNDSFQFLTGQNSRLGIYGLQNVFEFVSHLKANCFRLW